MADTSTTPKRRPAKARASATSTPVASTTERKVAAAKAEPTPANRRATAAGADGSGAVARRPALSLPTKARPSRSAIGPPSKDASTRAKSAGAATGSPVPAITKTSGRAAKAPGRTDKAPAAKPAHAGASRVKAAQPAKVASPAKTAQPAKVASPAKTAQPAKPVKASAQAKSAPPKVASPAKGAPGKGAGGKKEGLSKASARNGSVSPSKAVSSPRGPSTAAPSRGLLSSRRPAEPARRTEGYSDERFLRRQEAALEAERQTYMEQARNLREEAESLVEEMEPGDIQFDDESGEGGTVTVDRERDLALSAQALAAVDEIGHALGKIRAGTYGLCESCGRLIPKMRLEALPYARLCIDCKSGGLSRR